jgi:hypothetical protein
MKTAILVIGIAALVIVCGILWRASMAQAGNGENPNLPGATTNTRSGFTTKYAEHSAARASETPLRINGITEGDILTGLKSAEKAQAIFDASASHAQKLSRAQQNELQKQVDSIVATRKALEQNDGVEAAIQPAGNRITIRSVTMKKSGFIFIKRPNFPNRIGISALLSSGAHRDIVIDLDRRVDCAQLELFLYQDDGDGVFKEQSDSHMNGAYSEAHKILAVGGNRDPRAAYYSGLYKSSAMLLLGQQVPGDWVEFTHVSPPFGLPGGRKNHFIAIFKDANGLPGRVIGHNKVETWANEVRLSESVSDEMLYAMMFQDDDDGVFDLNKDLPVHCDDGTLTIVKFPVIQ